jgi:calpain-7
MNWYCQNPLAYCVCAHVSPHPATDDSPRSCRLQLAAPTSYAIPISIALFKRGPSGTLKDQVSTSGPYTDPVSGVVTPQTFLEAGIYVVVPSTYAARVEAGFTISVYASRKLEMAAV